MTTSKVTLPFDQAAEKYFTPPPNSTCGHPLAPDGHYHPVYYLGKEISRHCCKCANHKPEQPSTASGNNGIQELALVKRFVRIPLE